MSLWLSEEELYELTGKRQRAKQIKVLSEYRPIIRFRIRPEDSFPLVDRAQFETVPTATKRREPNFGALQRVG